MTVEHIKSTIFRSSPFGHYSIQEKHWKPGENHCITIDKCNIMLDIKYVHGDHF